MRSVLLLGALVAFAAAPSAQTFGASVSGLITTLDSPFDPDAVLGIGASVFAETDVQPGLRAGVEMGYTQAGFSVEIPVTDSEDGVGSLTDAYRAHYVTLGPVVTALLRADGVRPYLAGGFRAEALVAETHRIGGEPSDGRMYDALAVGAVGGLGVLVPTASRELRAGLHVSTSRPLRDQRQTTVEVRLGVTL